MSTKPKKQQKPAAQSQEPVLGGWMRERLSRAAAEWDAKPEWSKPVVASPFFAHRADMCWPRCVKHGGTV